MGVGLEPLEFTDCLTDSPYFRDNLHSHERELDKTSQQIKRLIKEVKDLLLAAKSKFISLYFIIHYALQIRLRINVVTVTTITLIFINIHRIAKRRWDAAMVFFS